jgi:GNAT superfamily N-acetyltransferase
MTSIAYRDLERHEAALLSTIDRSEQIESVYESTGTALQLRAAAYAIDAWEPRELSALTARLEAAIAGEGAAFGAWHAERLVGVGSLHRGPVGGDPQTMKLDILYVSRGYRQQGIGKTLTQFIVTAARERGATALYISATPTRATVDSYLRLGAKVLAVPDPELLALEPQDIHLLLKL